MQGQLIQSIGPNEGFKLDPRTKLLLMFLINVTIFGGGVMYVMIMMAAIPLLLLLASRKIKVALYWTLAYAIAVLANVFLVPVTDGLLNIVVVMFSSMLYRMMPGFIMGCYLITTTTVSEFLASMERMNVSQKITIPLSVMFRFFPTIVEEASAIRDAMEMRGVSFGTNKLYKNPMSIIEYRLIPLLMSTVKIGEELSAASLTRGLGNPVKRTNICSIGFGIQDVIFSILGITGFIGFILL